MIISHIRRVCCIALSHQACAIPASSAYVAKYRTAAPSAGPASAYAHVQDKNEGFNPQDLLIRDCLERSSPFVYASQVSKHLSQLGEDDQNKIKLFTLEHEMLLVSGENVPQSLNDQKLIYLLYNCPTEASRKRALHFWNVTEITKMKSKLKPIEPEKDEESKDESEVAYNKIMHFIRRPQMRNHYINNLCHAIRFGPTVVVDCGFENEMREKEIYNVAKQMHSMSLFNLTSRDPFHLHFASLDVESVLWRSIQSASGGTFTEIPNTVTGDCFMEHYPKDRLLYLSPDATQTLKKVDPNIIHIIGGLADMGKVRPTTLTKAKKLGIKTAKLPLHLVRWEKGGKRLTIDCVLKLLHDRQTSQWMPALLKRLPQRKYRPPEIQ